VFFSNYKKKHTTGEATHVEHLSFLPPEHTVFLTFFGMYPRSSGISRIWRPTAPGFWDSRFG